MRIVRTKAAIKKLLQGLFVLAIVSSFIGLGLWQLDRAQEMRNPTQIKVDSKIYQLTSLTQSTETIPAGSIGKSVTATGNYIANYKAPNQIDGSKNVADWEVALLQTQSNPDAAILVVRGLWKDRMVEPRIAMSNTVEVSGTLMPHQFDDRAENTSQQLSRLDSSLLVSSIDAQLYDGFVIATSEKIRDGSIERTRVIPPKLTSGVPGYYWQHISYVVVWWFMAGLVLWMPFYRRRESQI
jgi:cytochrome oxidase assembly protein ShyY1